jgi:hypothetical protein
MRKNCRRAMKGMSEGKPSRGSESIWTDGVNVYSYRTCILARVSEHTAVLNRSQYSITTTIHQNAIAAWSMLEFGIRILDIVHGLDRGVTAETVIAAASGATSTMGVK